MVRLVLHRHRALRRWERALPFSLESWDSVLGLNEAVIKAELEVHFKDTAAPAAVVSELVKAEAGDCRRRRPEQSVLHQAVREGWPQVAAAMRLLHHTHVTGYAPLPGAAQPTGGNPWEMNGNRPFLKT